MSDQDSEPFREPELRPGAILVDNEQEPDDEQERDDFEEEEEEEAEEDDVVDVREADDAPWTPVPRGRGRGPVQQAEAP